MALNIPYSSQQRIVIVGGGFAGLTLARKLANSKYQVILLDRNNYHQFQPLLYQVATSGLNPGDVAFSLRRILRKHQNVYFRMAEIIAVSPDNNLLETTIGNISYDFLVLASGSVVNFFQIDSIRRQALPMKNINDSITIRNHLLRSFEHATTAKTRGERQAALNIVVVGGGPTGVELVGAIMEMKSHLVATDYPDIRLDDINIFLIEGSERLLGSMSWRTSVDTYNLLYKKGVRIILNTVVTDYDSGRVVFRDGSYIRSNNLIWASGVKCEPLDGLTPKVCSEHGRIMTDNYFRAAGHSNIFVVGDASMQRSDAYPSGYPQLASVAIAQGKHLAANFKRMRLDKPLAEFVYKPRPKMVTVGRNHAFAEIGRMRLGGFVGWVAWLTIHLVAMMGFKNKFNVMTTWIWSYLTYDHPNRMIIEPAAKKPIKDHRTIVKMRLF